MSSDWWWWNRIEGKIDKALALLGAIQKEDIIMAGELDALKGALAQTETDVTAIKDAEASAVKLLNDLTAQGKVLQQELADAIAAGNPAEIQAAADRLKAQNQAVEAMTADLAAAIVANTPA